MLLIAMANEITLYKERAQTHPENDMFLAIVTNECSLPAIMKTRTVHDDIT